MATKKTKELRTFSNDQLQSALQEERIHLMELRMQQATAGLKNVKEIHQTRKTIARILTLLQPTTH